MRWASAVSDKPSLEQAVDECVSSIGREHAEGGLDLAVAFVSSHHAEEYERAPGLVQEALGARVFTGCSAGGVIGGGTEVEHRSGFALTVAQLPGVELHPFHLEESDLPDADASPQAWEEKLGVSPQESPCFLVLADPFTFPAPDLIQGLDYAYSGSVKVGGMASGATQPGDNVLYLGDQVHRSGAVCIAMHGNIVVDTIVAQGCRPIGRPMQVTRCDGNLLMELDGEPPIPVLQRLIPTLDDRDQELARHSLFLGVVMDGLLVHPGQGDFLIRNLMGGNPNTGVLSIGELLREGQTVQFHLRDARTSAEDLDALLARYAHGFEGEQNEGALLFSCLGRGEYLYGHADHDTNLFRERVGSLPLGGFFCNGEIGPVGGTTFLHGYTSSFAIFRPKAGG